VRIVCIPLGYSAECRVHKSQRQNKKEAFAKVCELIKRHYENLLAQERIDTTAVVRTYHAVENRVKDHLSGHKQSYEEVFDDLSDMIAHRTEAKLNETEEHRHEGKGSESVGHDAGIREEGRDR
jgi:protein subunit release factor A